VENSSDVLLSWIVGIALLVIFVPPIVWTIVKRVKHKSRRRLVDGPRKIAVLPEAAEPQPCQHERSKSRARTAADGTIYSTCKRCGVTMKRLGPGAWEAR
jgi:hypothetical protein